MKVPNHLHLLSKLRMTDLPAIPVYAIMAKTSHFITYLFPLPIIMSEKGGTYAVEDPEVKNERKVMSLDKGELLDKSLRQ